MTVYCYREDGDFREFSDGPNFSNSNAMMIFRSLGYEQTDYVMTFDPDELLGRVTMARATPPVADDGMPDVRHGNFIACGVRPGYFESAYERIAEVCERAREWGVEVVVA